MAEKEARVQDALAQVAAERSALTDAYAMIDRLTTPPHQPVPQTPAEKDQSIIALTIRELAQGDTRMAQYLHQRKRELKAEHPRMSDDGIAALLAKFETSEDVLGALA